MNPVPKFQSVPATAHLFDLAGAMIDYPDIAEEAAKFQVKKGISSYIGGFFGKKWAYNSFDATKIKETENSK